MAGLLVGKKALVGGASQGIGRACAIELAKLGAGVTIMARDEKALADVVAKLDVSGGQKHDFLAVDFSDPNALCERVTRHLQDRGPVQILVNNTGGPPHGALVDATPEQFLKAVSDHVVCNQLLIQAVLPGMKAAGYGRIVNIISTSVVAPIKGLGVSNTTRGAVAQWGKTLAGELAPLGITVNNVLPGYTATARLRTLFDAKAAKAGKTANEIERQTVEAIPMGRLADPSEIGAVVAFLASPAASYVTGVNLPVDGGRTAVQ
jgi:3-oxoacyl-[acyl-carrier protein] reductase